MPRSRGSEIPERRSPRVPLQLRTSSSESDGVHSSMTNRPTVDRSPKLSSDRRSPRNPIAEIARNRSFMFVEAEDLDSKIYGAETGAEGPIYMDSPPDKKRGTRISDLETQLGQAQEELKKLKEQLASSEAAKKEVQEELENTKKQIPAEDPPQTDETPQIHETQEKNSIDIVFAKSCEEENAFDENSPETDVFEVPAVPGLVSVEPNIEVGHTPEQEDYETKPTEECSEALLAEMEKPVDSPESAEITKLNVKLAEKDKELESFCAENDELKRQVSEAAAEASVARAKEEEAALKLSHMGMELEESKARTAQLTEELKAVEGVKLALETEMKKLRVQTEQWRKAADAAAAVLAGGADVNGRVAERCSSMDKHLGGYDPVGYTGFGSPMADDSDDGLGGGKRKGSGIRMFGDLWKKKGHK